MKWFTLKSIRTKIGLAILGLVAALVGATVTLFKVGLDTELLSIEDAGTKRDSWLFEHTVEQEFVKLEQALQAWAKWDDLLNFFHSPQDAFLDANFTYSALSVTGSDFALIGRPDASTMFSTQLNHTSQNTEQFNPSLLNLVKSYRELFSFSSLEGTVKGFLRNNDKLILITATSVSNTARTAEPVGTLIMGRIISEDTVRDWGKVLTNTINLSLYDPSSSQLFASQKNTDTLRSVYIPFKDPRGDVVAHVELAFPRTAYLKGIAARNQIIFATLLIGAVFLALTYLLLNTLLGRRFNVLQKQLIGIVDDPLHAKPVCSEGNDELSMLGAAFNKVLLSLAEHRQEAQRANAAKSRFLANMSHEIRTPINGVLGMLELLTTTDLKAEQLEYAQLAKNSVIDLTKIVNDILDLSKIEAQKIVVEKAPFSLNQILDEIWKPTEITASDKGLIMVKVVDTEVPEYLNGDSGKIKQILLNLLTNSVKFTNCGGIFVLVSAKETENAGLLKIECIVSDTGRGFSESDSARLFKPFEQVDGSDTRTTKGKGLGLTISRQLASLMDGTLEARSAPGVGACFILALPLEPAFQFTTKGESPVVEWWNMGTRQCNILVAEDNGVNQTLVQRILEKAGHLVTVVSDGQAAVHCCSHNNFDVVLMDIQMPKLSGLDATKLIKADPKNANLPIIALTASVLDQDRDLYLQAGMAGVVAKPLRPIDLISAINHHMHCQTGPREK